MTQQIVLRSLEELGRFADVILPEEAISTDRALVPQAPIPDTQLNIDTLVETIRRSAEELQALSVADTQARKQAEEALAKYRRLTADAGHLERIADEAQTVAEKAAMFAAEAFAPECHVGATRVAAAASFVASEAKKRLGTVTVETDSLAVRDDVTRLLTEEREREDAARREAEEGKREVQLAQAMAEAELLARTRNFDEALRRLGCLAKEHPNDPRLASCIDKVRRQEWAVKTTVTQQALREARRNRRDPQAAIEVLEQLDLASTPDALARQVYGCWLKACSRLGRSGATHYSAGFCKGAILVPNGDGRLEVISAMGLPRWNKGQSFSLTALKGVRPLK